MNRLSATGLEAALNWQRELGRMVEEKCSAPTVMALLNAPEGRESPALRAAELFELCPFEQLLLCWCAYGAARLLPPPGREAAAERYRLYGKGELADRPLSGLFSPTGEGICLHPVLTGWLLLQGPVLPPHTRLLPCREEPSFLESSIAEALDALWQNPPIRPLAVVLEGRRASGRLFSVRQLCARRDIPLLVVDCRQHQLPQAEDVALAAALYGAAVCLRGEPKAQEYLLEGLYPHLDLVFCTTLPDHRLQTGSYRSWTLSLNPPGMELRRQAWAFFSDGLPCSEELSPERVALSHRLSAGQIKNLCAQLQLRAACCPGRELTRSDLMDTAREELGPESVAVRFSADCGLSDLVAPPAILRQLGQVCKMARGRERVYGEWGLGSRVTYGRGISLLLYGAPGTGKTLAAQAVAGELGHELYRVELSALVSKYIGETQKNIAGVFAFARRQDCVLLFDEADALFARRTEGGDAQDRYSNTEIACLLQQIEQHDGMVVMATNMLQNFDEAFRRRITFMVHLPMPDQALRKRLWQSFLPPRAPREELDWELLSQRFEFSGAEIKNSMVYAACAAAADGCPLGMKQVLAGVAGELNKQGKSLSARQIPEYRHLLEEDATC